MASLKDFVKEQTTLSKLMEGKTKKPLKEICNEEITLNNFDILSDNYGKAYTVCTFDEYPDNFVFGGSVITDILCKLVAKFGDKTAHEMVQNEKLRMKFTVRTSARMGDNGRPNQYTAVEVL